MANYVRKFGFFEILRFSPVKFKNCKINKCSFLLLNYIPLMGNFFTIEKFKAQLSSKIPFFRKLTIFLLKIKNSRIAKIVFLVFKSIISSCEISSPWSNLNPSCVQKSEFFKIQRFSLLNSKILKSLLMFFFLTFKYSPLI